MFSGSPVQAWYHSGSVSRRHLERQFRQILGRSPAQEICRARIERAKVLLRQTSLRMPQIARAVGWANYKVLAMAFRRETGLSPSQYRRKHAPLAPRR